MKKWYTQSIPKLPKVSKLKKKTADAKDTKI